MIITLGLCTTAVVCRLSSMFFERFLFLTVTGFSRSKMTVLLPTHFPAKAASKLYLIIPSTN